ncbi:RING-H2 finger protein ATL2B, putative [Perkinsus marinus ATCC 50983]|uniref:RING-H2 finger protein ATL2B, putative n=1 Tax=Perkinsus marinus (strain ATCC 50983 / TXsc) TaxID=423536 RepID=C5KIM2_PERM5|nr:RING-H2 finger protein ATL2B, putative [Perkinsus marinus ATCC 50983]EER15637.1 RING-H2 finger protein ATL2B, putative [Perkinsus marinus ATCC 50983]|eukprot:XP_002783841.1 RING-H2 finger protein ATL2B, putative [Perkinsus marinus ATCC 50983]
MVRAAVLICYGCFVTILPPVLIVVVAYVLEKSHSADKRREKCEKAFFDEWSLWVSSETKIEKLSDADIEDCMEKGDNSGCVICLEDFAVGDDVRVLPCGHKFHVQCFDSCFDRLPCNPALEFHQCPLCRTQLGPSLPKRNLTGGISDDIIITRTSSVSEASTTVSV